MTQNFILHTIQSTPPVTLIIASLCLSTSFLVYLDIINALDLSFSMHYILQGQLWRIFTCFLYFGKFSTDTFLHIIFFCRYSRMLEESLNSSDYLYFILLLCSLIYSVSFLVQYNFASILSSAITYVWTRRNPTAHVQLFGCVVFPAFYLPFVVPTFALISDRKLPRDDVFGLLIGHVLYFFRFVWPRFGRNYLTTPWIIKYVFGEVEWVAEPVRRRNDSSVREDTASKSVVSETRVEKETKEKEVVGKIENVSKMDNDLINSDFTEESVNENIDDKSKKEESVKLSDSLIVHDSVTEKKKNDKCVKNDELNDESVKNDESNDEILKNEESRSESAKNGESEKNDELSSESAKNDESNESSIDEKRKSKENTDSSDFEDWANFEDDI